MYLPWIYCHLVEDLQYYIGDTPRKWMNTFWTRWLLTFVEEDWRNLHLWLLFFLLFWKYIVNQDLQFLLPIHGDDKMNWNRFNRRGKESHEMLTDELLYSLSIWFQWSIQNFYGTKFVLFKVHYETALNTFPDLQQCQWQCPPSFDICEWGARKISKWNYI